MPLSLPTLPPAFPGLFTGGINHPDLWLWDSWTYRDGDTLNLYTLALSRKAEDGSDIDHSERNNYPFHFRRFKSVDNGASWRDLGAIFEPAAGTYYDRNVWSGSALKLPDGRVLMGFTGLRRVDDDHLFLQNIGLAISKDGHTLDTVQPAPLSCPRRDYEAIIAAGYFLGPKNNLGSKDGEDGGPILAWRDPYFFLDKDGKLHCLWSAKISAKVGAIAHATLIETGTGFEIETLHPPLTLPDANTITQAEVPKVYFDDAEQIYYMLVSACDRLYEGQDDSEVSKTLRLYTAEKISGPWAPYRGKQTILPNLPHMFGAGIIETDFENGTASLIAPITEFAPKDLQLTIAPVQTIKVRPDSAKA